LNIPKLILLNSSYKLKRFTNHVFLAADEPIDVQRKNILAQLKTRAERDSKLDKVHEGVLIVDNIAILSLEKGNLLLSQPIPDNGDH
jgi:hypothetical protein